MVNYVQRARDVRFLLHTHGTEQGLIKAVERLCEDNEMMRQEMEQIVRTVDKMADIISQIATVGKALKDEWTEVLRRLHPNNEDIQGRQ